MRVWPLTPAGLPVPIPNRAALALYPPGHSGRSLSLNSLASSLSDRFEQQGVLSDLNEAIDLDRAALALCPPSHSDRSIFLNDLAISLSGRFEQRGVLSDLDEAIDLLRAALALRPPGHSCWDRMKAREYERNRCKSENE